MSSTSSPQTSHRYPCSQRAMAWTLDNSKFSGVRPVSDVAKFHRFAQPRVRIARGNEFLSNETFVADLQQLSHDRRVIDFLGIVQFTSTWISGRVNVSYHVLAFFDPPDDIAVHDLDVV